MKGRFVQASDSVLRRRGKEPLPDILRPSVLAVPIPDNPGQCLDTVLWAEG